MKNDALFAFQGPKSAEFVKKKFSLKDMKLGYKLLSTKFFEKKYSKNNLFSKNLSIFCQLISNFWYVIWNRLEDHFSSEAKVVYRIWSEIWNSNLKRTLMYISYLLISSTEVPNYCPRITDIQLRSRIMIKHKFYWHSVLLFLNWNG